MNINLTQKERTLLEDQKAMRKSVSKNIIIMQTRPNALNLSRCFKPLPNRNSST